MLILEIMLAIIGTILLALVLCGIAFSFVVVVSKLVSRRADKKEKMQKELYPDYYAKVEEYNQKYGEAVKFENEHISAKKQEIDDLEKEIKYLPEEHTEAQMKRIAILKEEIFKNTCKLKDFVKAYKIE